MQKSLASVLPLTLLGGIGMLAYCYCDFFYGFENRVLATLTIVAIWIGVVYAILRNGVTRDLVKPSSVLLSIFYASCLVIGSQFDRSNTLQISPLHNLLLIALLSCTFIPLLYGLTNRLNQSSLTQKTAVNKMPSALMPICIASICASWLLWYCVLYPGVYGYDGAFCLYEHIDSSATLTNHFSLLYTYLYSKLFVIGRSLFGTNEGGFGFYTAVQMGFVLFCAIRVLKYVHEHSSGNILTIATAIFYCIMPMHPILSVSSAQDPVFMALFSMIVMRFSELARNTPLFFQSKRHVISTTVLLLLLCLIRNNGFYALLFALAILPFLVSSNYRVKCLTFFLLPILLLTVLRGPIQTAIGVAKSNSLGEMMTIPFVQLARVYTYHNEDPEVADRVSRYIGKDALSLYNVRSEIGDPYKVEFNYDAFNSDIVSFLKTYIRLGLKYPHEYILAFSLQTHGAWYPFKTYPDERMYHPFIETECLDATLYNSKYESVASLSLIPSLDAIVNSLFEGEQTPGLGRGPGLIYSIPVISLLVKFGTYFFLLTFLTVYSIQKKDRGLGIVLLPVVGLLLTVLLAPCMLYRYFSPITFCIPLLCLQATYEHKP